MTSYMSTAMTIGWGMVAITFITLNLLDSAIACIILGAIFVWAFERMENMK